METLTLVVGSRNHSSWSLRPWLAMRQCRVPFTDVCILLDRPDTKAKIAEYSPSGRVPVLLHGDLAVWDSLAIVEYVAELFPDAGLWPHDAPTRARARSVTAEMHSSFQALRTHCTMDLHRRKPGPGVGPGVDEDVRRLRLLWAECLDRSGGPFLFGDFSIADAFYAPVVTRFRTYGFDAGGAAAWADRVWNLPAMVEWVTLAAAEPA